jgi:hypothetical protein
MEGLDTTISGTLAEEAARYLAVIDFFRREGCEPRWRPESESGSAVRTTPAPQKSTRRRQA